MVYYRDFITTSISSGAPAFNTLIFSGGMLLNL